MKRETRYSKEKQVKEVMFKVLEQNPEGTGSEEFINLVRGQIAVSKGKIFDLVKFFVNAGKMTIERNPRDRRKAIYKPVLQRVKTDRKVFQASQFIETLSDPIHAYKGRGKVTVSFFFDLAGKGNRKYWQNYVDESVESAVKQYRHVLRTLKGKLLTGQKLAVVLTYES